MADSIHTILAVYIVWHPNYPKGSDIAELIREHFRNGRYKNVLGDVGLSVVFRSSPASGAATPLDIDSSEAETTAVVVLAESALAGDPAWRKYVDGLINDAEAKGLGSRVFPVTLEKAGLDIGFDVQALRWHCWEGNDKERRQRLIRELSYEFSRMLRHYIEHLKHPGEDDKGLEHYLEKVRVFLSHSKHDGEGLAQEIRDWLHQSSGLSSFFDVLDIPAGTHFTDVLNLEVKRSALVAVHTDSYSSREWCRREIIEAKRWNVPMIVVNSMRDIDERGFPYMGNVPIVRMEPNKTAPDKTVRIEKVIGHLLDEVFKDFLWRCRIALTGTGLKVLFMPRHPELISLANLPTRTEVANPMIVYPDPPLGDEEKQLFQKIAPHVRLQNLTQWLTEV